MDVGDILAGIGWAGFTFVETDGGVKGEMGRIKGRVSRRR